MIAISSSNRCWPKRRRAMPSLVGAWGSRAIFAISASARSLRSGIPASAVASVACNESLRKFLRARLNGARQCCLATGKPSAHNSQPTRLLLPKRSIRTAHAIACWVAPVG